MIGDSLISYGVFSGGSGCLLESIGHLGGLSLERYSSGWAAVLSYLSTWVKTQGLHYCRVGMLDNSELFQLLEVPWAKVWYHRFGARQRHTHHLHLLSYRQKLISCHRQHPYPPLTPPPPQLQVGQQCGL